ncbi:MAG: iron-sulfur cluster assembly accessory protein [Enterobacterales bacterium]|nr:iron-sulfur cluster assembly accessory protein [Enterobacterales bacterium]
MSANNKLVQTFDPLKVSPVAFTDSAITHLKKQVENQNALGIVFNVKESGCSGYKYLLELAFDKSDTAHVYAVTDSLELYVEPSIIDLIRGTQVDYVQEGVNYRLDFKNPNATASCGCGESFSVSPVE